VRRGAATLGRGEPLDEREIVRPARRKICQQFTRVGV
jgi:hypothetical protein